MISVREKPGNCGIGIANFGTKSLQFEIRNPNFQSDLFPILTPVLTPGPQNRTNRGNKAHKELDKSIGLY
jgi:hypothetical protein